MQTDGVVSEDIDGFKYRVYMLDPLTAADILADLGQLLGPSLGSLGGVLATQKGGTIENLMEGFEEGEGDSVASALEKAIKEFFSRFSKEKQRELIGAMMKKTMIVMPDGKEPPLTGLFNTHFQGRTKAMYQWFFFALKVQFKDFFSGLDGGIGRVIGQAVGRVAG